MISILILCKNEERDLPGCLDSVRWSDDVHVFDSFSSDRTAEIARAGGANVVMRKFDDWSSHRSAAMRECPFLHEWVLILDADERVTPALVAEMRARLLEVDPHTSAFRMQRKDFFLGTWIKHSQMSPFFIRLVRPEKIGYQRSVNEVTLVEGGIGELTECFEHFPFSKGVQQWIERHNGYSSLEAEEVIRARIERTYKFSIATALFGRDFNERRYHQKGIFYSMPFRPLIKFAYLMFFRRAFLDGRAGITYAILQTIYEYFIVLKTRELLTAPKSLPNAKPLDALELGTEPVSATTGRSGQFR